MTKPWRSSFNFCPCVIYAFFLSIKKFNNCSLNEVRLQNSRFYSLNHSSQGAKRRKQIARALQGAVRGEKATVGFPYNEFVLTRGPGLDQNYRRGFKNSLTAVAAADAIFPLVNGRCHF